MVWKEAELKGALILLRGNESHLKTRVQPRRTKSPPNLKYFVSGSFADNKLPSSMHINAVYMGLAGLCGFNTYLFLLGSQRTKQKPSHGTVRETEAALQNVTVYTHYRLLPLVGRVKD